MGPDPATLAVAVATCQRGCRHAGQPAERRTPPPVGRADRDGAQSRRSTGSSRKAPLGDIAVVLVVVLVVVVVTGSVDEVVVVGGVDVVVVVGTALFLVYGTHSSRRWINSGVAGPNWSL
jgi:hypothetical protein